MCNLRQPVSGPDPNALYTGAAAPISESPISGVDSSLDSAPDVPQSTTMQPTKFAKLLKVVTPLIQGGLAGAASNPRQSGGGEAAANFFRTQVELQMQRQALKNQTANIQSEQEWRKAEAQRAQAQAQGVGRIYQAEDATGERHSYRIRPDGSSEDLGKNPLPDRYQSVNTAGGLDTLDTRTGVMNPVIEDQAQPGELPMPNQTEPRQVQAPPKPAPRPTVLPEGAEAVDASGKVVAKGQPKQFAPKQPSVSNQKETQQRQAESYADQFLKAFGGDYDKANQFVEQSKTLDPALKPLIRKTMRDIKKPATTRKFQPSEDTMRKLATAPPD